MTRSIPWPRILAEGVAIVVSILLAFGIQAWWEESQERAEEQEYLLRLLDGLQRDTAQYQFILDRIDRKEASLRRLAPILSAGSDDRPDESLLLADLAAASNFGWNVGPLGERATYEDLQSSGKLGLIRDQDLRNSIIDYYGDALSEDRRIEARSTDFPRIAYRIVPSARDMEPGEFGASERAEAEDMEGLLRALRASDLASHVLAETNRALFIRNVISRLRGRALSLLDQLATHVQQPF